MESSILKQIVRFLQEQKKQRRWLAVFLCMALIVGLGTVAALKMRGQAMTHKERKLVCRLDVHQHTDECYADEEKEELICGLADYVVHQHNDDCYSEEGELCCTLPEIEKHEHTEECYEEQRNLICGQEEAEGHQHTEDCYITQQGELVCEETEHQHDDSCYDEEGTLACGMEEHQHTDECFAWEDVPACGMEEGEEGHIHTDECYETEEVLACGKLELHSHSDACYEKIDEDKEYSEENRRLVCTIPVLEEHVHTEEAGCIEITEPGEKGADPADDQEEESSQKENAGQTVKEEPDQNETAEPAEEEAGRKPDLILTAEEEDYTITVMAAKEAFPDAKGELTLKIRRLGEDTKEYQAAKRLVSEQKSPQLPFDMAIEEEGREIPVDLSEEAAEAVNGDSEASGKLADEEELSENAGKDGGRHYVFDIIILEDGKEIQPQIPVKVTFRPKSGDGKESVGEIGGTEEGSGRVFHVDTETDTVEDMGAATDEDGNIVIDTPHFSVFDLVAGEAGDVAPADSWEVLRQNFYDGKYNGRHIRLTLQGDLEFTGNPIYLDSNRYLTIDLNGHSIYCGEEFVSLDQGMSGEKAMFVVGYSEGELVIEDTSAVTEELKDAFLGRPASTEEKEWTEKGMKIGMIKNETEKDIHLIKADKDGKVTINGGYLKNTKSTVFNVCGQNYEKELVRFTKGYMYSADIWGDLMQMVNNGGHSDLSVKLNEELECTGRIWMDRARDLTLDLNGHCISVGEQADTCVFSVGDNNLESHLTILDSAYDNMSQEKKDQIDKRDDEAMPATEPKAGQYVYENKTGEYYLTESMPEADQVHTGETTYRHRLNFNGLGAIENTRKDSLNAIIEMYKDGKVTIKSGRFSNAYGSAIASPNYMENENINLEVEGGYFVGNGQKKARNEGGAIDFEGQGNVTIGKNAVIAVNKANTRGGGIRIKGKDNGLADNTTADVRIDGAIICSNVAGNGNESSGGGIYAQDARVEYGSGYISNNQVDNNPSYDTGGGGFYLYWSSLEMKGGYITANKSNMGGGGLMFLNSNFQITAGTIAGNRANAEGGGIRVASDSIGTIRIPETGPDSDLVSNPGTSGRVYITNNSTTSSVMKENGETRDWGGGGIFIADNGSVLRIEAALITDNEAEGFGGGVGGCSTGRIFDEDTENQDSASVNVNRTAAIYGNSAEGSRLSGGDSSKNDDHDAHNNSFFMKDKGFQDVFSALGCYISSSMLGGGDANWKGSCDFKPIENDSGLIASSKMLGLTSESSAEDRDKAVSAAKVVLSGNSSGTHGGGIMCNGILVLGRVENLSFDDSLRVNLRKDYKDSDGNPIDLNKGQFMFALLDADQFIDAYPEQNRLEAVDGKVVYKDESIQDAVIAYGSNSSDAGKNVQLLVSYKLNQIFSEEFGDESLRSYSYYLMEVPMGDSGIEYDHAIYKITLNLKKGTRMINMGQNETMTITYLYIDNGIDGGIQVKKLDGEQLTETEFSVGYSGDYGGTTGHQGTYVNIEGAAFTNQAKEKPLTFKIFKTNEKKEALGYVPFVLHKLDEEGKIESSSERFYTDADGKVPYTVPNEDGNYLLTEDIPKGYEDAGPWFVEVKKDEKPQLYYAEEGQDGSYHKTNRPLKEEGDAFHIVNTEKRYELPETGGFGPIIYTMAGTLCILLGAGFMYRKKVRERRV